MLKINCPFRKPRKRCQDNIKMNLRVMSIVGFGTSGIEPPVSFTKMPIKLIMVHFNVSLKCTVSNYRMMNNALQRTWKEATVLI
jgi:hypothetical protein